MLEASHQCDSRLMYVGGRSASAPVRVWSPSVCGTRIGFSCQPCPSGSGISKPDAGSRSCANQSWVWNWIHAAASRFNEVAGVNVSRRISVRLIVCGSGSISPGIASGNARSSDTLRPKRLPASPMSGSSRAL